MYSLLLLLGSVTVLVMIILNLPVFGRVPRGERLFKIKQLSNYQNGAIDNQSPTPALPPGVSYWQLLRKVIKGNPKSSPSQELPHQLPDFEPAEGLKITWFGHSSYLIQIDGKNLLVDPIFSERSSPFQFIGTRRFKGTDFVKAEELPELDIVLLTHDHYDHLDYHTILKLKDKTKCFIASLGVGEHLERWGIDPADIRELSWGESCAVGNIQLTALPGRHFSGRKFKRNQTLWSSFSLRTARHHLFLGGDSGYDQHFKTIGEQYGPFDLAILECGQYNDMWPLIHLAPEEVVTAALALKAKYLMPVHWAKFKLALHDWDEPILRLTAAAEKTGLNLITPMLGQTFNFDENKPAQAWWKSLSDRTR